MRVLLTGCHGFIGRNVNDELMEREDVDSVVCIEKDYMNYEGWQSSLVKVVQDCDVILHVGAISDTMLKDPNEMMNCCLLYTSPSPRDRQKSRMPSSA